ncbi:MAG: hypothetical protein E6Q88_07895 [Lysobacteraceae bacterium]|nr:MAG: hypothetical protein E6Q88_07895 [Xanthomonadaceae bacterium]
MSFAGATTAFAALLEFAEIAGLPLPGLAAIGGVVVLLACLVAVHECGHAVLAHARGMLVSHIHVFHLQLLRRRSRWSWRLRRMVKGMNWGGVMAFPTSATPLREGLAWMSAGGPLANLVLAGLASAALRLPLPPLVEDPLIALLALNLGLGIGNLLPHLGKSYVSDGLRLWQLRRDLPEDDEGILFLKLNGLCFEGVCAQDLPRADVAALAALQTPLALLAYWFRFIAARNLGDWEEATRIADEFRSALSQQPSHVREGYAEMAGLIAAEDAACRAFNTRSSEPLETVEPGKEWSWHTPHLWPRLQALRAALQGDRHATQRHLAEARRHAEEHLDLATVRSEAVLRRRIRGLIAENSGATVPARS